MRLAILFLSLCAAAAAQKILIITDMEGVGGVNDREEQVLPGQRRFDESKRLLTGEVNAAVQGAFEGGAKEVVIWDGHDGSRSLSISEIDQRARLIQGKPTPPNYYMDHKLYDGIMWVGQHAMAGAKDGVLAHTQSFSVARVTINGRPVGEVGQAAAIGGYFGIPAIMLSGDQAACDEMRDLQPHAEVVAVKRMMGKASTLSLPHEQAKEQIRAAARRAVSHINDYKPWKIDGPVEMKFESKPDGDMPGRVSVFKGANVLEAFQAWLNR